MSTAEKSPVPVEQSELGKVIRRLRKEREWSQAQLADLAGVKRSAVSQYERGRRQPQSRTLRRIAEALGVSVPYMERLALPRMDQQKGPEATALGYLNPVNEAVIGRMFEVLDRVLVESGAGEVALQYAKASEPRFEVSGLLFASAAKDLEARNLRAPAAFAYNAAMIAHAVCGRLDESLAAAQQALRLSVGQSDEVIAARTNDVSLGYVLAGRDESRWTRSLKSAQQAFERAKHSENPRLQAVIRLNMATMNLGRTQVSGAVPGAVGEFIAAWSSKAPDATDLYRAMARLTLLGARPEKEDELLRQAAAEVRSALTTEGPAADDVAWCLGAMVFHSKLVRRGQTGQLHLMGRRDPIVDERYVFVGLSMPSPGPYGGRVGLMYDAAALPRLLTPELLSSAKQVVGILHGPDHAVFKELVEFERECTAGG